MKRTCETCAAWESLLKGHSGRCTFSPPVLVSTQSSSWGVYPETGPSDTCFQWKPMFRGKCKDCEYWRMHEKDQGSCRRHTPRMLIRGEDIFVGWPMVDADDFCGEWDPARSEDK